MHRAFEAAIRLALPALCITDGTKPPCSHSCERVQENDLFINCHPTISVSYGTKTTRKPALLLRFCGSLALRFAIRQLTALLFHEPPRNTRLEPSTFTLNMFKNVFSELERVGKLRESQQWRNVLLIIVPAPDL